MNMMKKATSNIIVHSYDFWGIIAFLFNCCQSIISEVVFGFFNLYIFDVLMVDASRWTMVLAALFFTAIYFILAIPLWGYLMEKSVNAIKANIADFLVEKCFSMKPEIMGKKHSAHILSMLQEDVSKTSGLGGWQLVVLIQAVISGTAAVIVFGTLSVEILVVLIAVGMITIAVNILCAKKGRAYSIEARRKTEDRLKSMIDFINNIIIVKVFQIADERIWDIMQSSKKICRLQKKIYHMELLTNSMQDFVFNGIYRIIILVMGLYYYNCGEITFGAIMFMLSMSEGLSFCIGSIGSYIKNVQEILVSRNIIDDFCEESREEDPLKELKKRNLMEPHVDKIEFKNVNFTYPETDLPVFKDMNLILHRGSDYIIVGENGSGKSSLMKLFFGLYQPVGGKILINEKTSEERICDRAAYIPQEPSIFGNTLLYNLTLGERDCDIDELRMVLQTVELEEWVNTLPEKVNTVLQEKGKDVSRGQKARIAMARALLQKPDFLFMDEIDANIDIGMMERLLKNMKKNYNNCSIVAITHRGEDNIFGDFIKVQIKDYKCFIC